MAEAKLTSRKKIAPKDAPSTTPPRLDRLVGHVDSLQPLIEAHLKGRLASTLLFAGPSGVGKKLAARRLAQALVCEMPAATGAPCEHCGPCLRVASGQSESVRVVEPDGASIKIEQAREVLQFITLQRLGRARVIIINQAHLMNPQAANALLKALEEPPAGTYFILITPLAASILPTIRSRSQLVRFRPLTLSELREVLGDVDDWILRSARGSVEVARQLLDGAEEFRELERALGAYLKTASVAFPSAEAATLKELTKERTAQTFVAQSLQALMRDLFHARLSEGPVHPAGLFDLVGAEASARFNDADLDALSDLTLNLEREMAGHIDRGLLFENFALRWRQAGAGYALD